jgi:hypothetical protein
MAVSMKMAVFWVVALCRLLRVCQHFRGLYCLHHQGDDCQTTQRYNPEDRHLQVLGVLYIKLHHVSKGLT